MSVDSSRVLEKRTPRLRQPKKGKSRFTNHHDLLPHVEDGRRSSARRFRDLVHGYVSDAGGLGCCSEVKLGLIRRLAAATVLAEQIEAKMINGAEVNIATLCTLASTTVRIASRLGLERHAKPVESLAEYLAQRREQQPSPEPEPETEDGEVLP